MNKLLLYDKNGALLHNTLMEAQYIPRSLGQLFCHRVKGVIHHFVVFDVSAGTFPVRTPNGEVDEAFADIVSAHEPDGTSEAFAEVNRMRRMQGLSLAQSLSESQRSC